jgi:hypothetical protein
MAGLGSVRRFFATAARLLRPGQTFDCAECDRWERCGLPPSEECIARAAHLAERNGTDREAGERSRWLRSPGAGQVRSGA